MCLRRADDFDDFESCEERRCGDPCDRDAAVLPEVSTASKYRHGLGGPFRLRRSNGLKFTEDSRDQFGHRGMNVHGALYYV